jgi:hypothetical protein
MSLEEQVRSVLFRIFSMIQIPALNNAVLFSGDYLLALSSNDATNPTVCYIVQAVNAEELIITQLLTREQILALNLEAPPTVPIDTYNNTVQCHLTEVFEVRSSPITINRACVRDIAFVFHINSLERAFPNCSGMTRVFFIRFFYDDNNRLSEVYYHHHFPFSRVVTDSYTSRIWHTISELKVIIEKCLNDKKQYQMCKKMHVMSCSLEAWIFLAMNLVRGGAILVQFSRRITRKNMHCDLSLSSATERQPFTLVRIDASESMRSARTIFGVTFGVGIRNRPPNKGESPVRMHYGDVINFVDVASNNYDNMPEVCYERRKELVSDQGVDFIYNKCFRTLKIRIRYKKSMANNPVIHEILGLTTLPNRAVLSDNLDRWVSHIIPGTYFATNDGEMASVSRVDGNNVFILIEDSDAEVVLGLHEAAALLRDYIG